MVDYVEISDEGAAMSAAGQLSELGGRLDDQNPPPQVVWGDDRFGTTMLESYNKENIPWETLGEKPKLGRALTRLGDRTTAALTEASNQELLNAVDISEVQAPDV
jgi:hypothetical protein